MAKNKLDELIEDIGNGFVEYTPGEIESGADVSTVGEVLDTGRLPNSAAHNQMMDNAQMGVTETRMPIAGGEAVVRAESGKATIGYTVTPAKVVGE